jgi:hypothetical protein
VFSDCQKLTKVKSQIRVKVRGDEDDEWENWSYPSRA